MFIKKSNYYICKEFTNLGVEAIYTTIDCGSLSPYNNPRGLSQLRDFVENIGQSKKKLIFAKQSHSKNIIVLNDNIKDSYDDVDGFVTNRKDLLIATFYADCLPIYAYDRSKEVIGICHSGWLGSYKEIGSELVDTMISAYGSKIEDITIQLGIGISAQVYEVQDEFKEKFKGKFPENIIEQSFHHKNNKIYFDNQKFNYILLEKKGISKILTTDICTYLNTELHSYRRDKGHAGRSAGIISFI